MDFQYYPLPIRNLRKHSFRIAFGATLVAIISSLSTEKNLMLLAFRASATFLLFYGVCIANIFSMKAFEKKIGSFKQLSKRVGLCTYFFTLLLVLIIRQLALYLNHKGLLPETYSKDLLLHGHNNGWHYYLYIPFFAGLIFYFVFFLHNLIILQYVKTKSDLEIAELKSANIETANQLLRQQIQPHFLFNALNVLKSLIKRYPNTAEEYLIKLSDFLRASMAADRNGITTVKDELKLCSDYMEMQKIRFSNALNYTVNIANEEAILNKKIPNFSLQPLLENAIKHNDLTAQAPLHIEVSLSGDYICVRNNLQPKKHVEYSNGSGLKNLQERYRILSGDVIRITKDEQYFTVLLKVLDHENSNN